MLDGPIPEALTFDDVLLLPAKSEVLPSRVDVSTQLTRQIRLNIPLISAAMVTVPVGTTLEEAKAILHKHKIEKLLVVDRENHLKGLITVKDIQKMIRYPLACKDALGRLRVGAALGVGAETIDRARALIQARVDLLVIDTAHGHSAGV